MSKVRRRLRDERDREGERKKERKKTIVAKAGVTAVARSDEPISRDRSGFNLPARHDSLARIYVSLSRILSFRLILTAASFAQENERCACFHSPARPNVDKTTRITTMRQQKASVHVCVRILPRGFLPIVYLRCPSLDSRDSRSHNTRRAHSKG